MKDKKIPESYSEKYEKKETESSIDIKSFVDSLFKASEEEEKKTLKVTAQAVKKSQYLATHYRHIHKNSPYPKSLL